MKKTETSTKRKLILDRETLQPLQADSLADVVGGAAISNVNTCLFNSCKTRVNAAAGGSCPQG